MDLYIQASRTLAEPAHSWLPRRAADPGSGPQNDLRPQCQAPVNRTALYDRIYYSVTNVFIISLSASGQPGAGSTRDLGGGRAVAGDKGRRVSGY